MNAPDNLPLPNLYLIDSGRLLAELTRIRGLVLQVPLTETSYAATQTVVDAIWRLETDMREILKVQATIHRSFAEKGEKLDKEQAKASQPLVLVYVSFPDRRISNGK